jgi:hypothetical protein
MSPENFVNISVFEIQIYSLTAVDVSVDDRHVPYVGRVECENDTLTIYQSPHGGVPGVEYWSLPMAQEDHETGLLVSRFPIITSSLKIDYGHPTRILIWVHGLVAGAQS